MRTDNISFETNGVYYKLPTASRAKSLHIPKAECFRILKVYEKALYQSNVSKHKVKRYELERKRYFQMLRKQPSNGEWVMLRKKVESESSRCLLS